MNNYLLIQPSDDGKPCTFLVDNVQDVLEKPEDYGIEKFLEKIPLKDPNYWEVGTALLLKVEVLKPKIKATAFKLDD